MRIRTFLFFILGLWIPHLLCQEMGAVGSMQLVFPSQAVVPGDELTGIMRLTLLPGWHTYWKNPGDSGLAPSFDWDLPHGVTLKEVAWPTPSLIKQGDSTVYGYEGSPEWLVRLSFDKDMSPDVYSIRVTAFFLGCDGMCTPITSQSECSITVSSSAPKNVSWNITEATISKLPIPLASGEAIIDQNTLHLNVPLYEEQTALAKEIIVFPEIGGLFPSHVVPSRKQEEKNLSLSIQLSPQGIEALREKKEFSGLVQVIFKDSQVTYAINAPVTYTASPSVASPPQQKLWKEKDTSLKKDFGSIPLSFTAILIAAFFGGLLLNITPCVLPVIGLKVLHLLSFRDKNHIFIHGVLFTLGALSAFWALAGALYFLESLGTLVGWGFQLQEPFFIAALIIILFMMSMNLFGLYEVGTSLSSWASEKESSLRKNPSLWSTYVNGLLATLIATPCIGPLLGSVIGFAATFEPRDGFFLFSAIGLGMASPFLLITLCPPLFRLLPRPGPWMLSLKQFFGFLLLATILWLLWVLSNEVHSLSLLLVFLAFFLLALGSWILGRWGSLARNGFVRSIASIFFLILFVSGTVSFLLSFESQLTPIFKKYMPQYQEIPWKPYSNNALEMELRKGHTVFVNFSAKWCLTCQANKIIFYSPKVIEAFQKSKIIALHADWTNGDEEITTMLRALGRNGVPVYAIFRQDKEPILLPEILTPERLAQAIKETLSKDGQHP